MDDDTDPSELRAGSEAPGMSLFDSGDTPRPSTSEIRDSLRSHKTPLYSKTPGDSERLLESDGDHLIGGEGYRPPPAKLFPIGPMPLGPRRRR